MKAPIAPPVGTTGTVVIERVLPNPVGNDEQLEEVPIRNKGAATVSLVGWTLEDRSGGTWTLLGSLGPNQSRTFLRNGQAMSLNNAGDEVILRDAGDSERDRFEYGGQLKARRSPLNTRVSPESLTVNAVARTRNGQDADPTRGAAETTCVNVSITMPRVILKCLTYGAALRSRWQWFTSSRIQGYVS